MPPVHIALVISSRQSYFREALCGVRRYALTKPDWVFLFMPAEPAFVRTLYESPPDGVISQVRTTALSAALLKLKRPTVNISRALPDLPFPRVATDDDQIARQVAAHLLERGLRNFGFVGYPGYEYTARRAAAFREALAHAGCALDCFYTPIEESATARTRPWSRSKRIRDWLAELPKPVGIFASNDEWAAQLSEVCRAAGLKIPDEVALVGVDNDDLLCELARPPLSSVALPAEQIGYEAAALLDRLLGGETLKKKPGQLPSVQLPPVGVVVRQSSDVVAIDDAEVSAALRCIQQHRHLPLQVADVLREVPVSRRSLERRVRRAIGRTLGEEICRVHLERAQQLLGSTDLSMATVAEHSGFGDQKQLCVAFRKHLKCTPTEYRRQFRGDKTARAFVVPASAGNRAPCAKPSDHPKT